jgi:hypothetical protein
MSSLNTLAHYELPRMSAYRFQRHFVTVPLLGWLGVGVSLRKAGFDPRPIQSETPDRPWDRSSSSVSFHKCSTLIFHSSTTDAQLLPQMTAPSNKNTSLKEFVKNYILRKVPALLGFIRTFLHIYT